MQSLIDKLQENVIENRRSLLINPAQEELKRQTATTLRINPPPPLITNHNTPPTILINE